MCAALGAAAGEALDGKNRIERAGAEAGGVERHVLKANLFERCGDGVKHLHGECARQLADGRSQRLSQLAMMADAQFPAEAQLAQRSPRRIPP